MDNVIKGVLCCGGTGTRLKPLTTVINKHLVAVGRKCMVEYPLEILLDSGIKDILVVTGGEHLGAFLEFLGSGKRFGCKITYKVQDDPHGIPDAIRCAEEFIGNDRFVAILGDNFFSTGLSDYIYNWHKGAMCILQQNPRWRSHGVAIVKDGKVIELQEKPTEFISDMVVTGAYLLDPECFDIIRGLKLSSRNEYEITEVLDGYRKRDKLFSLEYGGYWSDMGTFEGRLRVEDYLANR